MKKLFLLGGHNLEMIEIKEILDLQKEHYEDKKLKWGAKLSDYQEFLDFEGTIYGIELEEDIAVPENYIAIDHHGKNDAKKSSLEQVAELLNIELSRTQQLIAANDSRYIGGMKCLCATQEEIDEIRRRDIKAQKIDPLEIKKAEESFKCAKKEKNNFIFSKSQFFSPLSDLAYYEFDNYIIYDDSKVLFYRYQKKEILDFLASQNIDKKSYYYGGGECGFVGLKEGVFDKKNIKDFLEKFKEFIKKEEVYSYHTFMLPFTYSREFQKEGNWKHVEYEIDDQRNYNEFNYFYEHVQDLLFQTSGNKNEKWISKYYEYEKQNGTYEINCKHGIYKLELDGISLHIFNTGVAILAFNLKNTSSHDLNSILAINDFGRRIYPQFLGRNFTKETKESILANSIVLHLEGEEPLVENFCYFNKDENLKEQRLLPKYISGLIEKNFDSEANIRPIIDDRMFVVSQYNSDALVQSLQVYSDGAYAYESSDEWYKYMFVDGGDKTCQSRHMSKKLIDDATYDRWVEWGTLFGVTRYSFVAATGSWYGKEILLPHMQTMYFQMFTLLLFYRATIIKFADDIQNATTNDEEITAKSKEVYKNYLSFLNKSFFKEITAQDQGIEIYNQAMKAMDIDKYMEDLDNEINELHSYVSMLEETKRNNRLEYISKLGAIFLPPSLMAGFFGMNVLTFEGTWWNETLALGLIVLSGVLGYLILSLFTLTSEIKKKRVKRFLNSFSISLLFGVFLFVGIIKTFDYFSDKPNLAQQNENNITKELKKCLNIK